MTDDGQKQMVTGHITVKNADGEVIDQMRPAKWYFRKHEEEPTTEVAIRRAFAEDLYIVMPAFEIEEQTASVEVHINPLVNWVWFGFGILAIGTGIALLPEASLSFAAREAARRSGDRVDAAAVDPALERRGVRAARRDRTGSAAAAGVAGGARGQRTSSRAGAAAVRSCRSGSARAATARRFAPKSTRC